MEAAVRKIIESTLVSADGAKTFGTGVVVLTYHPSERLQ